MRKKIKRLHSEDARFLRNIFYDLIARMNELEFHVGELQRRFPALPEARATVLDEPEALRDAQ